MEARMSLQARRELLNKLRARYRGADKKQKNKILDEFIQVTQYGRKHAIALSQLYLANTMLLATKYSRGARK